MAIYNYVCKECGEEREETHLMSESPEIICSTCGKQMKITIPKTLNFILKGGGWASKGNNIAKAKPFRETRIGIDPAMNPAVSDELKKRADKIEVGP